MEENETGPIDSKNHIVIYDNVSTNLSYTSGDSLFNPNKELEEETKIEDIDEDEEAEPKEGLVEYDSSSDSSEDWDEEDDITKQLSDQSEEAEEISSKFEFTTGVQIQGDSDDQTASVFGVSVQSSHTGGENEENLRPIEQKSFQDGHENAETINKRSCPFSNETAPRGEALEAAPGSSRASMGGNPMVNGTDADFRRFHILDETDEDEDDKAVSDDSDVPDDEVEKMLEDALENRKRTAEEAGLDASDVSQPFEEKDKIVLIENDRNHFDILPEGWMQVIHNSGMPIYLHKITRVCTLSRPYFLGPGSARKHEIPLSAVPCLSYRRYLEQEEKQAAEKSSAPATNNPQEFPTAKIQTVEETIEAQNLKAEQLRQYCEKLFKFKTIRVIRFNSWMERRQYTKKKKQQERQLQRPMLPDGTKLITFPIQNSDPGKNNGNTKKEWIMNPNGKSYVCILHEYVQHALKKQPSYKFTELENAATPYAATVLIDNMQYGVGYGTSKKQAKSEAARSTLEILIPEMRQKITKDEKTGNSTSKGDDYDSSFFDEIRVEDPRVAEFCAKTTEPSPHDILLTCLQRNFGLEQLKIQYQGSTLKHQMNEFTMTVGKHTATVVCRNKRDGKQRASQAILQALHPHITSWGSLLRLYGNRSVKCFKEKKLEEQEITLLQSKAAMNSPNFAILNKLKTELLKLGQKRKAVKPIGVFIPPEGQKMPKLSSSNLKNVDL